MAARRQGGTQARAARAPPGAAPPPGHYIANNFPGASRGALIFFNAPRSRRWRWRPVAPRGGARRAAGIYAENQNNKGRSLRLDEVVAVAGRGGVGCGGRRSRSRCGGTTAPLSVPAGRAEGVAACGGRSRSSSRRAPVLDVCWCNKAVSSVRSFHREKCRFPLPCARNEIALCWHS